MKCNITYIKLDDNSITDWKVYESLEKGYLVFEGLNGSKYSGAYMVEIYIEHPQQGWILREIVFTNNEPELG